MIDNLIFGGIGFIGGIFVGFFIAVLLVSAKKYENEFDEEEKSKCQRKKMNAHVFDALNAMQYGYITSRYA